MIVVSRLSPSLSFLSNGHDRDEERNENDELLNVIPVNEREFGLALGFYCARLRDGNRVEEEWGVVGRNPAAPEAKKNKQNLPNQW